MQAKDCRERVLALKEWRTKKRLTVDQCIELCGDFPSDTSVRRVFAKGSEEKSFRESTIAAMEKALMGEVYNPDIKIPVEDVITAQRENAGIYAAKIQKEALINAQQRAKLHVCYFMLALFFAFDIIILVYDVTHFHIGFFNSASVFVWCIQVAFLAITAVTLSIFFVRYNIRKKKINELNQVTG